MTSVQQNPFPAGPRPRPCPDDVPAVTNQPATNQPRQPSGSAFPTDRGTDRAAAHEATRAAYEATHEALTQTLAISTAGTDDELMQRTLRAACAVTGAIVACSVDSSAAHLYGDEPLARDLLSAARCGRPRSNPTNAFSAIGLPAALTATIDATLLVVASTEPDRFDPAARGLLDLVATHARVGRDRLREFALLSRRANSDPLTGLRHYRPFEERLAASEPDQTAIIAIDIDNFKRINDEAGHQGGDRALITLVGALRRALRGDDHIYRIGGDEFAVVIDVSDQSEVVRISRRLLDAARQVGYPISVGAALRLPGESGRDTLLRADKALYQAKNAGRNTARLAA